VARPNFEIMDVTLRDGEQTPNVAYTPSEKFQLARLLLSELRVSRIEVGQAHASPGEAAAVRRITSWARRAKLSRSIEILGLVDGTRSVDWITHNGGSVMNLLTKGSRRHCEHQLRITPEEHFKRIAETVHYAQRRKLWVNVYLEDWSNGVRDSFDYLHAHVQNLVGLAVQRVYLPDTLGILCPDDTERFVGLMTRTWPEVHFEFHGHNDYGLGTANCLAAARAGARGVHTSVNSMGERAGNASLAEVVACLHDHTEFRTPVCEEKLVTVAEMVAALTGKALAENAPVVGRDVFTQTAGIHADGDTKADLYASRLAPARFGRRRRYALGKLSGKASLDQNLKAIGINLLPRNRDLVLQRIIELGDKKHKVTAEDLPLIIADVLKTPEENRVHIDQYEVLSSSSAAPRASLTLRFAGKTTTATASGDGGYDALMKALEKALKSHGVKLPALVDYKVRIPPGGKSGALVETVISWRSGARRPTFSTMGVDSDQLAAAVIATEKMLNLLMAPGGDA